MLNTHKSHISPPLCYHAMQIYENAPRGAVWALSIVHNIHRCVLRQPRAWPRARSCSRASQPRTRRPRPGYSAPSTLCTLVRLGSHTHVRHDCNATQVRHGGNAMQGWRSHARRTLTDFLSDSLCPLTGHVLPVICTRSSRRPKIRLAPNEHDRNLRSTDVPYLLDPLQLTSEFHPESQIRIEQQMEGSANRGNKREG